MDHFIRSQRLRRYHQCQKEFLERLETAAARSRLPFADVLDPQHVHHLLNELGVPYRNRVFSPLATLWAMVAQVLSADRSCRSAVSRFLAWLCEPGRKTCSSATGAYCQARKRMPELLLKRLSLDLGARLEQELRRADGGILPSQWGYQGRNVKLVDGTVLSMADTPDNKREYPPSKNGTSRKEDSSTTFPLIRLLVVFSLSSGAVLDLGMSAYSGKGSGESSLFMAKLKDPQSNAVQAGDIVLLDRLLCLFLVIGSVLAKRADVVARMNASTRRDQLRTVKRLGRGDRLIELDRPILREDRSDPEAMALLPMRIVLRELVYTVRARGFRPKTIVLLTSLLDARAHPKEQVGELYRERWHCELDLRSLKSVLQMDHIQCKTPEMVRKEIWARLLGYNLVRVVMSQSALLYQQKPRELSFKGALQLMEAFRPLLGRQHSLPVRNRHYRILLEAISQQKLVSRPNRLEPRAIKRRKKTYLPLLIPREEARKRYWRNGWAAEKRARDRAKELRA